ncbi:MAG: HAD family hydrolase [Thermomicrobiales bacterium]
MPELVIFLDDGGVMNDNARRAPQWRRLVGEYFAPRLGGAPDAWAEANFTMTTSLFAADAWLARLAAANSYADFRRTYHCDWLGEMCVLVGVLAPSEAECLALAQDAEEWIIGQVRAAFPGAADAIHTLYERGYILHTASGEASAELNGYLTGMGVRECFDRLYGPDLLDCFKTGPEYYARLLADAGVAPADALIVDDSPLALGWAAEVGARTVLVGGTALALDGQMQRIGSLVDLPALLHQRVAS